MGCGASAEEVHPSSSANAIGGVTATKNINLHNTAGNTTADAVGVMNPAPTHAITHTTSNHHQHAVNSIHSTHSPHHHQHTNTATTTTIITTPAATTPLLNNTNINNTTTSSSNRTNKQQDTSPIPSPHASQTNRTHQKQQHPTQQQQQHNTQAQTSPPPPQHHAQQPPQQQQLPLHHNTNTNNIDTVSSPSPSPSPTTVHPASSPRTTASSSSSSSSSTQLLAPSKNTGAPTGIFLGPSNRYELLDDVLGKGHFAKVQKCRDNQSGQLYALKIIDRKDMVKSAAIVKAEIDVLLAVKRHPYVVGLIDTFEDAKKFYLVMELCEGGDLFSKIVESGKYTEQQAARCCRQLAMALQHVHECGVVHRDLKPENILLATNDINSELKLADFGLSKLLKDEQHVMRTVCGTWAYCAPEVINRKPYSPAVDNWTLGVLMFILLSGYHPFDVYGDLPEADLLKRIVACKYDFDDPVWDQISIEAKQLIQNLLKLDPKQRMSLQDYLSSNWVSEGKGAKDAPLPKLGERLGKLDGGKYKFRTLILAKIASQKFAAKAKRASGSGLGFQLSTNPKTGLIAVVNNNNNGSHNIQNQNHSTMMPHTQHHHHHHHHHTSSNVHATANGTISNASSANSIETHELNNTNTSSTSTSTTSSNNINGSTSTAITATQDDTNGTYAAKQDSAANLKVKTEAQLHVTDIGRDNQLTTQT